MSAGIHAVQSSGGQGCSCFKAGFLKIFVKCRLRLFGLAKLSSSCLQIERYFSRCGESRERKGENVFRHPPPARGRCALKRGLPPTLLARFSVQEDATSRRGRLLLHDAWFASYVAGTLSVSNTTVCDAQLRKSIMMADVRLEGTRDNATWVATFMTSPLIVPKNDLFYAPSVGLEVQGILREQEGMRLGRTPELVWRKSACFATQLCRAFPSRSI